MNIENTETAITLIEEREKIISELKKLKSIEKDNVRAFFAGSVTKVRYFRDYDKNGSGYEDGFMKITPDELRHILINRINDESHKLFLVENKISKL